MANKKGSTYLLEFSEALTINQKNDKLLLTAVNIRLIKILFVYYHKSRIRRKQEIKYFVIITFLTSISNDIYLIILIAT